MPVRPLKIGHFIRPSIMTAAPASKTCGTGAKDTCGRKTGTVLSTGNPNAAERSADGLGRRMIGRRLGQRSIQQHNQPHQASKTF